MDSSIVALRWGDNVPVIKHQDARLNAQVVNLSGFPITVDQCKLLSLGLGYRVSPGYVPRLKLMAGVEAAYLDLRRTNLDSADWFCSESARIVAKARKPLPNLSPELLKAAKQLCQNEDMCITSADKGGRLCC